MGKYGESHLGFRGISGKAPYLVLAIVKGQLNLFSYQRNVIAVERVGVEG